MMRDRVDWETPAASLTLARELRLILEEVSLLERRQAERHRGRVDPTESAPHVDPAWLGDDPALD
jgi:hypothetical protein